MQESERMKRLLEIAEQDVIYQTWKNSYCNTSKKFQRIIKWCPKKIRSTLCGYADFGKIMNQRLVNIACSHMEFIETEEK